MNKFILAGRLGKDALVRETSNGNKFLTFTVAENRVVKKGETKTFWYDVTQFNYNDKLVPYLQKGKYLIVTGDLTCDIETGKDNVVRCRRVLNAVSIDFLDSGKNDNDGSDNKEKVTTQSDKEEFSMYSSQKKEEEEKPIISMVVENDDDLPF